MSENKKGSFIVIEGGDGSGKGTQTELLINYLKSNTIPHAHLDFPNYNSFFGELVAKFLRGELGKLNEISPYLSSLPFALDRNAMKETILSHLQDGKITVANRYVSSNMAHQGGKINNEEERLEFLKWLEEMEYSINKIPRPDITILLYMPLDYAKALTSQKKERSYLKGIKEDIQEADTDHRLKTEEMYTFLANNDNTWRIINCVENGTILSKAEIHEKIISLLKNEHIIT